MRPGVVRVAQPAPTLSFCENEINFLAVICGPLIILYLALCCEKSHCMIFEASLGVLFEPGYLFSTRATLVFVGFAVSALSFSSCLQCTGFTVLVCHSLLILLVGYWNLGYLEALYDEIPRILIATLIFCFLFSLILFVAVTLNIIPRDRGVANRIGFFQGSKIDLRVAHVSLKKFFYINFGMVTWALLDLVILLQACLKDKVTSSLFFLAVSQYLFNAYNLLNERIIGHGPFRITAGLGYSWLVRVLVYQPFFQCLPAYFAAETELSMSRTFIIIDCVIFLFGLYIYNRAVRERDNFKRNPAARMNVMRFRAGRYFLLAGGLWGHLQKPDYFGYILIWLSWAIACGFNLFTVIIVTCTACSIKLFLTETTRYKTIHFGNAWNQYIAYVPRKIIPGVY